MQCTKVVYAISLIVALMLTTSGVVTAQPVPQQYYGIGGQITGYVLGIGRQAIDWAAIYASNGRGTFQAFSGMSGVYLMRVPVGSYNVTVHVPGYEPSSKNATVTLNSSTNVDFSLKSVQVAVSAGSSSSINFYLDQTQVPVPEFQPNLALIVSLLTISAAIILRRAESDQ